MFAIFTVGGPGFRSEDVGPTVLQAVDHVFPEMSTRFSSKLKCVESSIRVHGLSGGVEESKLSSGRLLDFTR